MHLSLQMKLEILAEMTGILLSVSIGLACGSYHVHGLSILSGILGLILLRGRTTCNIGVKIKCDMWHE